MTLLFTDQDVLLFSPKLAERIGLNEAIVLQQIHYWITRETGGINHDGRKWIYNTLSQWRAQLPFMSESTIKRSMNTLKDLAFIDVQQLSNDGRDRTNYYTINQDKVRAEEALLLGSNRPMHQVNLTSSTGSNWSHPNRTETTTKTTEPRKRVSSAKTTLSQYLEQCQEEGRKPIPDDHCSRRYAADAGISPEMIALAWFSFVDTYRDGTGKAKKYADWGLAFNNAVKGNWAKLWYVARDSGTVNWTSEGLLYKATIDAKLGNS